MNTSEVIDAIHHSKIIAILRKVPLEQAVLAAEAVAAGGIGVVEVTMDGQDAPEIIQSIRQRQGTKVLIGAGTVITVEQLHQAVEAGADVLFCPHLDVELMREADDLNRLLIPGVMTPSEVAVAKQAGARVLKLFPAGPLGAGYLKDLLGPFSGTSFIPTGGIHEQNADAFLAAGAIAVGMGSSLLPKVDLDRGDWDALASRVQSIVSGLR